MNEQAMLVIRSGRPVVTGRRGAVARRLEGHGEEELTRVLGSAGWR
jgi:hypothetical protein